MVKSVVKTHYHVYISSFKSQDESIVPKTHLYHMSAWFRRHSLRHVS